MSTTHPSPSAVPRTECLCKFQVCSHIGQLPLSSMMIGTKGQRGREGGVRKHNERYTMMFEQKIQRPPLLLVMLPSTKVRFFPLMSSLNALCSVDPSSIQQHDCISTLPAPAPLPMLFLLLVPPPPRVSDVIVVARACKHAQGQHDQ